MKDETGEVMGRCAGMHSQAGTVCPVMFLVSHSSGSGFLGCCYQHDMSSFRVHTAPTSQEINRDYLKLIKLSRFILVQWNKFTVLLTAVYKLTARKSAWFRILRQLNSFPHTSHINTVFSSMTWSSIRPNSFRFVLQNFVCEVSCL
jgi:hypothetical protein